MSELTFAIPSKGRLKEQTEAFLSDCGFRLSQVGGDRGYVASLSGMPDVQVLLLSASEIAHGLISGDFHIGVTGEDLLNEYASQLNDEVFLLKRLGFGFARLVVAVPTSWIDVETMDDLEAAAHLFFSNHGQRMKVATKYVRMTRDFFARKGVSHHRIVESSGATEAAPASGSAELIVDITTTGATLAANNLKIVSDGEILRSEAAVSASLRANWDDMSKAGLKLILDRFAARERGRNSRFVSVFSGSVLDLSDGVDLETYGASIVGNHVEVNREQAPGLARQLSEVSKSSVAISEFEFVFDSENSLFRSFETKLTGE